MGNPVYLFPCNCPKTIKNIISLFPDFKCCFIFYIESTYIWVYFCSLHSTPLTFLPEIIFFSSPKYIIYCDCIF